MPSPVVAYSRKITWPDCSPPSAAPRRTISSSTYLSPTGVRTMRMPSASNAFSRPRLDMTVATTMFPGRRPAALSARPAASSTASPFTTLPADETKMARSASPSKATPKAAPCATTACLQGLQVERAAVEIDVAAVGRAADGNHLGAQPAEQLRRQAVRSAIAAIDGDLHAVQAQRGNAEQEIEILAAPVPLPRKAPAAQAPRPRPAG